MARLSEKYHMFFPLLLKRDGTPRKRQPAVVVGFNGTTVICSRGNIFIGPFWIKVVTDSCYRDAECFVGRRYRKDDANG